MPSNIEDMPAIHRFAYHFSYAGYRGSSAIWWVAKRLQNFPRGEIVRTPNGFPLTINNQDWTAKTIYEGTYERALLKLLATLDIKDLLIDVGANLGVTLWHGMLNANLQARYICFEPTTACQPELIRVTESLAQKGEILQKSVGDFDGIAKIYGIQNAKHSGSASLVINSGLGNEEITEVVKLDTILAQKNLMARVSLIKIDTEGYEPQVIRGLKKTLQLKLINILIMEVTPGFSDSIHFNLINASLGIDYIWFCLDESGIICKTPRLIEIHPDEASKFSLQYNLVIMSKSIVSAYLTQKNGIRIDFVCK
jgi:FkbM family methyltransferase